VSDLSKHAVQEILDNIRSRDMIKARVVLDHFDQINASEQRRILLELNKVEDDLALPLLAHLHQCSPVVQEKYPTIRETIVAKALNTPRAVIRCLGQENPARIYLIRLAGELHLADTVDELIRILLGSTDTATIKATIKALGDIGDSAATNVVSEFLYLDDLDLVREAVASLGRISTPTAVQRLAERLGTDEELAPAILDVFASVQDETSLAKLGDCLQSRSAVLRNLAKSRLAEIGAKAVPLLTANLDGHDHDCIIHSLNVLHDIGDSSAALAIRKLLNTRPDNANVRFAAYEALAALSGRKGDYVLAGGLEDPDSNVRMAAARAIDTNINDILVAGIRNMIKGGGSAAQEIVRAVIDGKAARVFSTLADDSVFKDLAFDYLATKAHPEIRNFFVQALLAEERPELANNVLRRAKDSVSKRIGKRVCAVDDSRMILNVYRSILTELGHEPILFQYPAEALEWLEQEKPDILCTDLNMPDITGVELIGLVRRRYTPEQLPIIMVTTQNEVQDNRAAYEAGVDDILSKPFDAAKLGQVLRKVCTAPQLLADDPE